MTTTNLDITTTGRKPRLLGNDLAELMPYINASAECLVDEGVNLS